MILIIIICLILLLIVQILRRKKNIKEELKILTRQTSRWAIASRQDINPIISVLHGNYAAGYLWAIKDIADSEQFNNATGIKLKTFEKEIIKVQDNAILKLIKKCPNLKTKKNMLAKLANI